MALVAARPARAAGRRRALALAAAGFTAALLLAPVGCQRVQTALSGKSDQGPELAALRQRISDFRTRLTSAAKGGGTEDPGAVLTDAGPLLDAIDKQAGEMSFMDGQSVKIQVATARNLVRDARPFTDSGDMAGFQAAQTKLDGVLFDIDNLLDRASMMTDNAPKSGS
ncbi:MAG: hypothetical protein ACM3JJ_03540 [Hyphomicrobiales bacterium]